MFKANRKRMQLLMCLEFPVVYPEQTVRGGEELLIEDWNVMVLHSFLKQDTTVGKFVEPPREELIGVGQEAENLG